MHYILRKGISLEDLVMNPKYTIIVDGDEYCLFKGLFEAGIINANDLEDISTNKSFWNDDIYECSYYFYNYHTASEDEEGETIKDIVGDIKSYQHTFKLRLDPFDDLEKFPYNEELIQKLLDAVKAKRPDIKLILSFYNYEKDKDVTTFKYNRNSINKFDSIEYETEKDDEDD